MIVLSGAGLTAISQEVVPIVQLIHIAFPGSPLAYNTSNWDFTYGGILYRGAYGMGKMRAIEDSPGEVKGLEFTLSGDSIDMIALALDEANLWPGVAVTLRTAILDQNYQIVDAPVTWAGKGDTMNIQAEDGSTVLTVTAESQAVNLLRGHAMFYNDPDQQSVFPGDKGFEYVVSQVDQPVVWPSKEFFYV